MNRQRHSIYQPLAYAAYLGQVHIMAMLIEAGADVNYDQEQSLMAATYSSEAKAGIELLIQYGVDVEIKRIGEKIFPIMLMIMPMRNIVMMTNMTTMAIKLVTITNIRMMILMVAITILRDTIMMVIIMKGATMMSTVTMEVVMNEMTMMGNKIIWTII